MSESQVDPKWTRVHGWGSYDGEQLATKKPYRVTAVLAQRGDIDSPLWDRLGYALTLTVGGLLIHFICAFLPRNSQLYLWDRKDGKLALWRYERRKR